MHQSLIIWFYFKMVSFFRWFEQVDGDNWRFKGGYFESKDFTNIPNIF